MNMFKGAEEREREQREQERMAEEQERLEKEMEKQQRKAEKEEKFQNELQAVKEMLDEKIGNNQRFICFTTEYDSAKKNTRLKEFLLNYLLEKGYVCVENETTWDHYKMHYVLTFVSMFSQDSYVANRK